MFPKRYFFVTTTRHYDHCAATAILHDMEYRILFSYFLTLPIFVVLDLAYARYVEVLSSSTNWYALAAFYVVYVLGLYYFAVYQGCLRQSLPVTLISGALFGFFTYATWGLLTMASLPSLPLLGIVLDTVRGAALSGAVAVAGFYLNRVVMSA